MAHRAILFLVTLLAHPLLSAASDKVVAPSTTQLPLGVTPHHYDVSITPNAAALTFSAKARITLAVEQPTSSITLNANGIKFDSASLTSLDDRMLQSATIKVNQHAQTATFSFARQVPKGRYKLALDYQGLIGQNSVGLFAVDYDSPGGKRRGLYTQLASSDARRLIPSWDEPFYKASFSLEAIVPPQDMAVSNMPIASRITLDKDRVQVRFAASPRMATYLFFFALGDFERITARVGGTELGVVTRKGVSAQGAYVLDATKTVLREYNAYFGIPYPLPKLDNIAAPGNGQFWAMENWGSILSYEHAMLLDPAIATPRDRQSAFSTAAHEVSHQWFGNLVTMNWWDDIWLNEGFASWMEARITRRLHPEWNTALDAVNEREIAMADDSVSTTHPVIQHVATVEQAGQVFDRITYQKGGAVISMLEQYVGESAWRTGVRRYMKVHAYGSTVSDDFWREIEKAAGKPIKTIAHDFTLQQGVPMIKVGAAVCTGGSTQVSLEQDEFTLDRPDKKPLSWRVPVIAQIAGGAIQVRAVIQDGRATMRLPGCGAVLVNAGQSGYYRTLYSPANFSALVNSFTRLAPVDQMGLLNDTWAQGRAGRQSPADLMKLIKAVPMGADPQVWGNVVLVAGAIHRYYNGDTPRQKRFDDYAIARLTPVLAQLGWSAKPGESVPAANLRGDVLQLLGGMGEPVVLAEARKRYAAAATDPEAVPAALRKTISEIVATHADRATWEAMLEEAKKQPSPPIKDQLYRQLSMATDPALARRALELAIAGESDTSNIVPMFNQVSMAHPALALSVAIEHREALARVVDDNARSRFYPKLAASSDDPAVIAMLNAFARAHIAEGARKPAETAIARIRDRIKVKAERLPAIDHWLVGERELQ